MRVRETLTLPFNHPYHTYVFRQRCDQLEGLSKCTRSDQLEGALLVREKVIYHHKSHEKMLTEAVAREGYGTPPLYSKRIKNFSEPITSKPNTQASGSVGVCEQRGVRVQLGETKARTLGNGRLMVRELVEENKVRGRRGRED